MNHDPTERDSYPSFERIVDMFLLFVQPGVTQSASSVAKAFGISRSSAYRYLTVLRSRGLIEEVGTTGDYRLCSTFVYLVGSCEEPTNLAAVAQPIVNELAMHLGETALFTVRIGDRAICVTHRESPQAVRVSVEPVLNTPLHLGSSAKVHLAHLGDREQQRVIDTLLRQPSTPETQKAISELPSLLREIRRRGWASSNGEIENGVHSTSVPVLSKAGALIGVLTVAAPIFRAPNLDELLSSLKAAGGRILKGIEPQENGMTEGQSKTEEISA